MISQINSVPEKPLFYPCLKHYVEKGRKGVEMRTVVLFSAKNTGVVVNTTAVDTSIGDYSDTWNEESFEPFNHIIVLSNK